MKNLLQNPAVVGSLALVAVVVVFMNIVMPLTGVGDIFSSKVGELFETRPLKAVKTALIAEEVELLDYSLIGWTETPIRDPFKPVEFSDPNMQIVEKDEYKNPVPANEILILSGVVIQPDFRIAMINKVIVKEGDIIGEYRVVSIKADMVSVSGPLGRETLSFSSAGPGSDRDEHGER